MHIDREYLKRWFTGYVQWPRHAFRRWRETDSLILKGLIPPIAFWGLLSLLAVPIAPFFIVGSVQIDMISLLIAMIAVMLVFFLQYFLAGLILATILPAKMNAHWLKKTFWMD